MPRAEYYQCTALSQLFHDDRSIDFQIPFTHIGSLRLLTAGSSIDMGERGVYVYTHKRPQKVCSVLLDKNIHTNTKLWLVLKNNSQNWTCLSPPLVLPCLELWCLVVEHGGRCPPYTPAPPAHLATAYRIIKVIKGSCRSRRTSVNRNHAAKTPRPLHMKFITV